MKRAALILLAVALAQVGGATLMALADTEPTSPVISAACVERLDDGSVMECVR